MVTGKRGFVLNQIRAQSGARLQLLQQEVPWWTFWIFVSLSCLGPGEKEESLFCVSLNSFLCLFSFALFFV